MENMTRCFRRYIGQDFIDKAKCPKVLDIGGANVNGSYRDIIEGFTFEYLAADIQDGHGVDVHMLDPYKIPLENESVDIIISGQAFEHVQFFWLLFEEMSRVLKKDGFIFLIAPSSGVIHRHPVDCYRFYPDSYHAIGKYVKLDVVEVFHDQRGPWKDLVGVFAKEHKSLLPIKNRIIDSSNSSLGAARVPLELDCTEEENKQEGVMPYRDFLKSVVHKKLQPTMYFEIGIRGGHSASLASCPTIGVDPAADLKVETPNLSLFKMQSDEFFNEFDSDFESPDLAFIDGMHLFEYALRDFINIEKKAHASTVVVVDDIYPNTKAQALRERKTRTWMGDIWKLVLCFEKYRPDLICIPVDTHPSGLLLILGLDSKSTILSDNYNQIIKHYSKVESPPREILERFNALSPNHPVIDKLLTTVCSLREKGVNTNQLKNQLKKIIVNNIGIAKIVHKA